MNRQFYVDAFMVMEDREINEELDNNREGILYSTADYRLHLMAKDIDDALRIAKINLPEKAIIRRVVDDGPVPRTRGPRVYNRHEEY